VAAATPASAVTGATGRGETSSAAVQTDAPSEIPDGADSYTVREGDSLWSIAKRVLGAEASPAQVAREVHRLWRLNADRIGTGDPNLIVAGQTLRLH